MRFTVLYEFLVTLYLFRCFPKVHIVLSVVMIADVEHLISRGWRYSYFDQDLAIKTIYAFR